jgi:hypothetical protein
MRARIVDNLLDTIDEFFGGAEGHRDDPKFLELCNRIEGREVDIVFNGKDAFEKEDNNYWLPECCWTIVKEQEQ